MEAASSGAAVDSASSLLQQASFVDLSLEFGSGKPPSKRDDPGRVNPKHALTAAHRKEIRDTKQAKAVRDARLEVAASAAARDLSAAHVGVVRSSLFDADVWKKDHAARQARMESTFGRLYKPTANSYWTKDQKVPARREKSGPLPSYTKALPEALSLAHPSSREIPSDESEDELEASAPPPHPAAEFDPLAEPRRFYTDFKSRVASLRGDVRRPEDRPAAPPRAADAVIAAATAPSPRQPPAAPVSEPPPWSTGRSALAGPILDEDFDVEPSLVYTDSAHYLADHGVNIPMWDEIDGELAALDAVHAQSMRALASYSPARGSQSH